MAVTGGARGIGAAIATEVVRRGARVAIGDLDEPSATATAALLGERAAGFALDVTDAASFAAFLDAAEARLGPVDVLVNNAGIMWVGRFHEEPEDVALRQFDVNLHGVLRGTKLAARADARARPRADRERGVVGQQDRAARRGHLHGHEARRVRLQRGRARGASRAAAWR